MSFESLLWPDISVSVITFSWIQAHPDLQSGCQKMALIFGSGLQIPNSGVLKAFYSLKFQFR
jgi:hypothetical protein